jgi:hypothetical protein
MPVARDIPAGEIFSHNNLSIIIPISDEIILFSGFSTNCHLTFLTFISLLSVMNTSVSGRVVYLKGYGFIKVFGIAAKDGSTEYWASSDTDKLSCIQLSDFSWIIEE